MKNVVFVTGSAEKALQFSRLIGRDIEHQRLDLEELQTLDVHAIAEQKAKQAYQQIGRPVLVEDVSFTLTELGQLPGPFIKYFVVAPSGVSKLAVMAAGLDSQAAEASCTYAYYDGENVSFFDSSLRGVVVSAPRGSGGFGFDRIFAPEGFDGRTAAELNEDEYDRYYSLVKPFNEIRRFLND